MATLRDLDELMRYLAGEAGQMSLDEFRVACLGELRKRHGGEKIYIPAPDTTRKTEIAEAARHLPTSVVAERFGIHPSYARKLRRGIIRRR